MTSPEATAWLAALRARGVRIEAHGKRITLYPKHAYGEMSTDERAVLKQHKAAILTLLKERRAAGLPVQATESTVALAPEPAYCPYCMRTPCCGPAHHAYEVLHADDPAHYWRRRERLREKDNAEL